MKEKPLVSVIIPSYNRARVLPRAINSVLNQTYSNFELIIIDDRSTDNTKEILKKYSEKDKRIRYMKNKHKKGPGGARNQGLEVSKGKYIAFLDSDDEWSKDHIKSSVDIIEKTNIFACASLCRKETDGKFEIQPKKEGIKAAIKISKDLLLMKKESFEERVIDNKFYCCHLNTFVFKKEILRKIGTFNENLPAAQDVEWLFRLTCDFDYYILQKIDYIYYEGIDNIYNFKDKKNIRKTTLSKKNQIKTFKVIKKYIKNSGKFRNTKRSIKTIHQHIYDNNLGVIKIQDNLFKKIYYSIFALYYAGSNIQRKKIRLIFKEYYDTKSNTFFSLLIARIMVRLIYIIELILKNRKKFN